MSVQTDREYLESKWKRAETMRDAGRASIRFFTDNELYFLKPCESEARLWAAGRKFTEDRLEEIRQIEREIEVTSQYGQQYTRQDIEQIISEAECDEDDQKFERWSNRLPEYARDFCTYERLVERLQSILEDKKRGMKL